MVLRKTAVALLLAGTAATASAADRSFPVGGFQRVQATGSEDVTIVTGKAPSVVATGPSDRLDRLDIRVEGDTLKIGHKPGNWMSWGREDIRIRVTVPAVKGIKLAGSGNVALDRGTGPEFSAELSGSGGLDIAQIDARSVLMDTSGSGNIAAAGKCVSAKVEISGSGDMSLVNLACQDVDVKISGSGNVAARASTTANVRISGSGDVKIVGGARCTTKSSGSGNIACG